MLKSTYMEFTCDGSGNADVADAHSISGLIYSIELFGSDLDAGADATISVTDTGRGADKTILTLTDAANVDNEFFPREQVHDNVGALIANAYTEPTAVGKMRVVIAQGGASKTGKVIVTYYSP